MRQYALLKIFTQLPPCGKLITNEETGNLPSKIEIAEFLSFFKFSCFLCMSDIDKDTKGTHINSLFHIEISGKISQNAFLTRQ